MTRYIVFTGPSQSGKSLAARLLARVLTSRSHRTCRDSFEAPVKHYLSMLLGRTLSGTTASTPIPELLSKTPTDFIAREAQHMRFSYGPTVLGKLLCMRVAKRNTDFVIIDDGTSVNDVRELGDYFLIEMRRDKIERVYPFVIPGADIVVDNGAGIEQLRNWMVKVAGILEGL